MIIFILYIISCFSEIDLDELSVAKYRQNKTLPSPYSDNPMLHWLYIPSVSF